MFRIEEELWKGQNLLDIETCWQEMEANPRTELKFPCFETPADIEEFDNVSINFRLPHSFALECGFIDINDFLDVSQYAMDSFVPGPSDYSCLFTNADVDAFDNVSLLSDISLPDFDLAPSWYNDIKPGDFLDVECICSDYEYYGFNHLFPSPEDIEYFDNVSLAMPDVMIFEDWDKIIGEIESYASGYIFDHTYSEKPAPLNNSLSRSAISLIKNSPKESNPKKALEKLEKSAVNIFNYNEAGEVFPSSKLEYEIPLRLTFEKGDMVFRLDLAKVSVGDSKKLQSSRSFSRALAQMPRSIKGKHFQASLEDHELRLVVPAIPNKKAQ